RPTRRSADPRGLGLTPVFAFKRLIAVAGAAVTLAAPAHAAVPAVNARAFFVVDGTTGDVLAQHAANTRLPVASITKLMTVLVTLEHARLSDVVTVRRQAAAIGESTINRRPGERITVRGLLAGALIQSANDAADALADYVAHGNDRAFVAMMNAEAKRLGLSGTHFVRPDGLDAPGHVSTARDVTRLAQELMKRPVVRALVRESCDRIRPGLGSARRGAARPACGARRPATRRTRRHAGGHRPAGAPRRAARRSAGLLGSAARGARAARRRALRLASRLLWQARLLRAPYFVPRRRLVLVIV